MPLHSGAAVKKAKKWKGPSVKRKKPKASVKKNGYSLEDINHLEYKAAELCLLDVATIVLSDGAESDRFKSENPFFCNDDKDLMYFVERKIFGNIIGILTENRYILEILHFDSERAEIIFYNVIAHRSYLSKHIFHVAE